jgi:hypothetical protein
MNKTIEKESKKMEPTEDEVVRPEELPKRPGPHTVHRAWLQVHQGSPGHIFLSWKRIKPTGLNYFKISRAIDFPLGSPTARVAWKACMGIFSKRHRILSLE